MNRKLLSIMLCLFLIVTLTACSNKLDEKTGSVQNTLFKITDQNNELLKSSSLDIKGANVSGEGGKFKAPLRTDKSYNLKMVANRFQTKTNKFRPEKGSSVVTYKMERNKLDISGAVKSNNKSVKGATVKIENINKSTTTNDQGIYEFNDVPSNKYNFTISRQGFSDKSFKYDVSKENLNNKDENTNPSNKMDIDINTNLESLPTVVKGQLVNNVNKSPLGNRIIRFKKINKEITTDEQGNFKTEMDTGNYTLIFDYSDFQKKTYNFDIPAGVTKNLGSIEVKPPNGHIKGVIKNDDNNNLLENIDVKLVESGNLTSTNSNGESSFDSLKPGTYSLKISHTDFSNEEKSVEVKSKQTSEPVILLTANPGRVEGITEPGANEVKLINQDNNNNYSGEIDSSGNFIFEGVVEGNYLLEITHDNYKLNDDISVTVNKNETNYIGKISLEPKDGTVTGTAPFLNTKLSLNGEVEEITDTADKSFTFNNIPTGQHTLYVELNDNYKDKEIPIDLGPGETVELEDISLETKPGIVEGVVEDQYSNLVGNVTVKLLEKNLMTTTDKEGKFVFKDIPVGDYTLELSHNDFLQKSLDIIVEKNSNISNNISLEGKPGNITGTTQPGATVSVDGLSKSTTADSAGGFRLEGIDPGNYTLNITHSDYDSKSTNFTVYRNETNNIGSISLEPLPGSITGKVINMENNNAIDGVTVTIDGKTTTTDSNGNFTIPDTNKGQEGLSPGFYSVTFNKTGYKEKTKGSIEVTANNQTDIGESKLENQASSKGNLQVNLESTDGKTPTGNILIEELGYEETNTSSLSISDIDTGTYTLSVKNADGYYNSTESITVLSEDITPTTTSKITLTETAPMIHGAVEGTLKYTNSIDTNMINNAKITVAGPNKVTYTNSSGYYKVDGLQEGYYDINYDLPTGETGTIKQIYIEPDTTKNASKSFGYSSGYVEYEAGTDYPRNQETTGWITWYPNSPVQLAMNKISFRNRMYLWNQSRVTEVYLYYRIYDTSGNLRVSDHFYTYDLDDGESWFPKTTFSKFKVGKVRIKLNGYLDNNPDIEINLSANN